MQMAISGLLSLVVSAVFILVSSQAGMAAEVKRYEIPLDGSQQHGPINAPVTMVEFLDFQ